MAHACNTALGSPRQETFKLKLQIEIMCGNKIQQGQRQVVVGTEHESQEWQQFQREAQVDIRDSSGTGRTSDGIGAGSNQGQG